MTSRRKAEAARITPPENAMRNPLGPAGPENAMRNPLGPAGHETPAEATARRTLAKIRQAEESAKAVAPLQKPEQ